MRTIILSITLFFCVVFYHAQNTMFQLEIKISNEASVSIDIAKNNSSFLAKRTDKNGKLTLSGLPYGNTYLLTLSKDNMVTKTMMVDAKTNYFSGETDEAKVILAVDMVKELDFVNYEIITGAPVGKMYINSSGVLDWDASYNQKRKNEIDAFLISVSELSEKNKNQYNDWLENAKKLIDEEKYDAAQIFLDKAKSMKETNRLTNLEMVLQQGKEKENNEKAMIAKIQHVADSLFTIRELPKALKYYQRIISLEPSHQLAAQQIEVINGLLTKTPPDPESRMRIISQEEMLANAQKAQQNRTELARSYKPTTFKQIERNLYYDPYSAVKPLIER